MSRRSKAKKKLITAILTALAVALTALISYCQGEGAPLGIIAGTDFAGGRPDQLVGITYHVSEHAGLFAVAHLEDDDPAFNARGILRAGLSPRIHALFLLGTEVTFDQGAARTKDFVTRLSLSTGLGLTYQPSPQLSTWIAVDYQPAAKSIKRARYALGIVIWLLD